MIAQNAYNPKGPTDHNANTTNPSNPVFGKTETPAAATTAKEEAR